MPKSESYKTALCCPGRECDRLGDDEDQPCWGQVDWAVDDYSEAILPWTHACQGHINSFRIDPEFQAYIPEPTDEEPV